MSALPPNPSLRHLKNEAKQLLRALEDGSSEAAARIKAHLRRVGEARQSHVQPADVSLQEAQHVIAREYGFATWVELADTVEPRFGRISELAKEHLEPPVELDMLARPLEQLDIDQIRQALHGMARLAQAHGIKALERVCSSVSSRFVAEALKITADGTEPDLILDTLMTRGQTMVRHLDTRMRVTIEGAAATRAGDNPGVVAHKLSALYSALYDEERRDPEKTVEQVQTRLRAKPASRLSHHELAMLYVDLAWIVRLGDESDFGVIADEVDDDFLRLAIHGLADPLQYGEEVGAFCRSLEKHIEPTTRAAGQRYCLFAEGVTAIREGKREADLDAAMDNAMGGDGA
jgi:hypothetical protein